MNLSFVIDNILYEKIEKNGKANGRGISAEARYQLGIIYKDMEVT